MNRMKRLLAFLAIAPAMCGAQQLSASVLYDFKAKVAIPIVSTRIGTIRNVFAKGFDLDVVAFAGVRAENGRLPATTGGMGIVYSRKIADNLDVQIGVAGRIEAGRSIAPAGFILGFGVRF